MSVLEVLAVGLIPPFVMGLLQELVWIAKRGEVSLAARHGAAPRSAPAA